MSKQNNLYNILAAFNKATKTEEVTPKQQAKQIYESVEAKGSIIGGVKGVEKKLSEAFAKHKVAEEYDPTSGAKERREKDARKAKAKEDATKKNVKEARYKHPDSKEAVENLRLSARASNLTDHGRKQMHKQADDMEARLKKDKVAEALDDADHKIAAYMRKYHCSQQEAMEALNYDKDYDSSELDEYTSNPTSNRFGTANLGMPPKKVKAEEGAMDDPFDSEYKDRGEKSDSAVRKHVAGPMGYGNQYGNEEDEIPPDANQIKRGRGRPKNVAGELKRKKAAEILARNGGVKQGRGRPKKNPVGGANSAPSGTLGLHNFLFGKMPDKLPGKPGMKHKMSDTGTEAGRVKAITGEGQKNEDYASDRGYGPSKNTKDAIARAQTKPSQPGTKSKSSPEDLMKGAADWYNKSTGGKRNMGDSKINSKTAVSEGTRPASFMEYLAEAAQIDASSALGHIVNRFRYEVKQFEEFGEMDDDGDLYHALYDYYGNNGEMPYGVAKARTGDPFEWVMRKFEQDMGFDTSPEFQESVGDDEEWYDAAGNVSPSGAYDAGGHYHHERAMDHADMDRDMDEAVDPVDIPAVQRKAQGKGPLSLDQAINPNKGHLSDKRNLGGDHARNTAELDRLAALAGISEALGGADRGAEVTHQGNWKMGGDTRMGDGSEVPSALKPRVRIKNIKTRQPIDRQSYASRDEAIKAFKAKNLNAREYTVEEISEDISVIGSGMEQEDDSKMNITTNQSSDGTKSMTVTADGEAAVALLGILKNAGMGGSDSAREQEAIIVSAGGEEEYCDDMEGCEEVEMEEDAEYANEPAPAYGTVDNINGGAGEGDYGQKRMHKHNYRGGDNPMAMAETTQVDPIKSMGRDLMAEYQALKLKK